MPLTTVPRMRARTARCSALILAATLLSGGCADDGVDLAAPGATASTGPAGVLYVQRGTAGSTRFDSEGSGSVTLEGVDPETVWFLDRPARGAGRLSTDEFVGEWADVGFAEVPPNAVLEISDVSGVGGDFAVELSDPVYDAGSGRLAYTAVLLDPADGVPPATFGAASLFIDDAINPGEPILLTFEFLPVTSGQNAQIMMAPLNTDLSFTLGHFMALDDLIRLDVPMSCCENFWISNDTVSLTTTGVSFELDLHVESSVSGAAEAVFSLVADPGLRVFVTFPNGNQVELTSTGSLYDLYTGAVVPTP